MKAFLLYRDRDFDLEAPLPPNHEALTQDLELNRIFDAMALGDEFLFDVARKAVLSSLTEPEAILYRQDVLRDCLAQPAVVRATYDLALEAIKGEKKVYWGFWSRTPEIILNRAVQVLEMFVGMLKRLRMISDEHAGSFRSDGFRRLFTMLAEELDDAYFETISDHLRELRFRQGVLISAELGKGNKGTRYILRRPRPLGLMDRVSAELGVGSSFRIPDRDENGHKALSELRAQGINQVANALAQSTDHILSFFQMLLAELGFYVGCLNLHERLAEKGEPICFPVPLPPQKPGLSCRGLYDACLSVSLDERVVGNDVAAEGKSLVMITGANRGGKSTFLRSVGLGQLMMQSGMFVPAEAFTSNVCAGLYTHFKREEDPTMRSGKLDEELSRMSDIADRITPSCMLLCNESFAATNEREGSEIARQIVDALLEKGVRVLFVTHMFELGHSYYRRGMDNALFLRAERQPDGRRTFRLREGEPLPTSHGEDIYRRVFGSAPQPATMPVRTS